MTADLVVWRTDPGTRYFVAGGLRSAPARQRVARGQPAADGFPADACFQLSKDSPKKGVLADAVENFGDAVLVSPRLEAFIRARAPAAVETLPVRLRDQKGADLGPLFLLNPLAIVDCIDQAASEVTWNALDKTQISGFKRFALDPAAIPGDLLLFRPKFYEHCVLARRDLTDAIVAAGFTGLRVADVATYLG